MFPKVRVQIPLESTASADVSSVRKSWNFSSTEFQVASFELFHGSKKKKGLKNIGIILAVYRERIYLIPTYRNRLVLKLQGTNVNHIDESCKLSMTELSMIIWILHRMCVFSLTIRRHQDKCHLLLIYPSQSIYRYINPFLKISSAVLK